MVAKVVALRMGLPRRTREARSWADAVARIGSISVQVGHARGLPVRVTLRDIAAEWPLMLTGVTLFLSALLMV